MKSFLKRMVARLTTRRPSRSKAPQRASVRPALEGLEDRCCPTTVRAFATALQIRLNIDVNRLVVDGLRAEQQARTLGGRTIAGDLVRLYRDTHAGAIVSAFNDFHTLAQHMATEDALVRAWHLPARWSLGSRATVVTDLVRVNYDKFVTIAFADYVASHATSAPQPSFGAFQGMVGMGDSWENEIMQRGNITLGPGAFQGIGGGVLDPNLHFPGTNVNPWTYAGAVQLLPGLAGLVF